MGGIAQRFCSCFLPSSPGFESWHRQTIFYDFRNIECSFPGQDCCFIKYPHLQKNLVTSTEMAALWLERSLLSQRLGFDSPVRKVASIEKPRLACVRFGGFKIWDTAKLESFLKQGGTKYLIGCGKENGILVVKTRKLLQS